MERLNFLTTVRLLTDLKGLILVEEVALSANLKIDIMALKA